MLGQSQEGMKRCGTNPFPFPLRIVHRYLAQGTCFQDSFWVKSRVQELDHETGFGKTPELAWPYSACWQVFFVLLARLKQIIYNILSKTSRSFTRLSGKLHVGIPRWFKQTNKWMIKERNKQAPLWINNISAKLCQDFTKHSGNLPVGSLISFKQTDNQRNSNQTNKQSPCKWKISQPNQVIYSQCLQKTIFGYHKMIQTNKQTFFL